MFSQRFLRIFATLLFVLVGLINLAPVIGVLGAAQLETLYGKPFADQDLLPLMRHRAVMLGLLGSFLILAACRRSLRTMATVAGILSMGSFCLLALPLEDHGQALQRVFWVDVVAIPILIFAWWLSKRTASHAGQADGQNLQSNGSEIAASNMISRHRGDYDS